MQVDFSPYSLSDIRQPCHSSPPIQLLPIPRKRVGRQHATMTAVAKRVYSCAAWLYLNPNLSRR